jgi:hypothetical protein
MVPAFFHHVKTSEPRCRLGAVYMSKRLPGGESTFPAIAPQIGKRKFKCVEVEVYQVGPLEAGFGTDFNKTKTVLTLQEVTK